MNTDRFCVYRLIPDQDSSRMHLIGAQPDRQNGRRKECGYIEPIFSINDADRFCEVRARPYTHPYLHLKNYRHLKEAVEADADHLMGVIADIQKKFIRNMHRLTTGLKARRAFLAPMWLKWKEGLHLAVYEDTRFTQTKVSGGVKCGHAFELYPYTASFSPSLHYSVQMSALPSLIRVVAYTDAPPKVIHDLRDMTMLACRALNARKMTERPALSRQAVVGAINVSN